ncbi:MAG: hypothetical protein ACP5NE_03755 [Candidatus Micrarchaeia archaeon]
MYARDIRRLKRLDLILERLAYLSIGLDFIVAIATLLLMKGLKFSMSLLMISDYLIFAEVIIAGALFLIMFAIRHYQKILEAMAEFSYRARNMGRKKA